MLIMLQRLGEQAKLLLWGRLALAAFLWFYVLAGGLSPWAALGLDSLLLLAAYLHYGTRVAVGAALVADIFACLTLFWLTPVYLSTWFALVLPVAEGAFAAGAAGGILAALGAALLMLPLAFTHGDIQYPGLVVLGIFLRLGSLGAIHGWFASQMRRARDTVQHMALHDQLTGLPNTRALYDDLARRCQSAGGQRPLSVLFFDSNGMKQINDRFGHRTGDEYLATLARELQGALGPSFTLYRYAGDEFVALGDVDGEGAQARMCGALAHLEAVPFADLTLSASGGVSVWEPDRRTPEALLTGADGAMYEMKRRHRGRRGAPYRP